MQQFRTVTGNNWFPSLAPDVPGRHFPQRNQAPGKIRVAGSKIFSRATHGACFQGNDTVHSAFIGGGRNLHQAQRVKRKIGGGKIPFLLSPQRKTAAILEKRKDIPFFVVPVCRRGRRRSHLRHTPYTLRKHALIASIHAFEARRACREHPAKSGIACQLRTISTMLPDTEAASPARGVAEPSNMTLDVSGDDSDALAAAPSSGADAPRTSMWSVGATNCAWPVIGRPPSKSNSSSSMTAITWTEDTVVMQYRRPGMVAIGVFKAIITPTLYPEGGKKTSPRFPAVRMTGNPIRGWDAGKGRGLVFFG